MVQSSKHNGNYFFTFILFFILLLTQSAKSQPKIYCDAGNEINLGDVAPVLHHYTAIISNQGNDTLVIDRVATSCGCTIVPIIQRSIAPSDTIHIDISFNLARYTGIKKSSVYIFSNDTKNREYVLNLTANVVRDLITEPDNFPTIINARPNEDYITEVKVKNTGKDTIELFTPVFKDKNLIINSNINGKLKIIPEEEINLKLLVKANDYGFFSEKVIIPTNSKFVKELSLNLIFQAKKD